MKTHLISAGQFVPFCGADSWFMWFQLKKFLDTQHNVGCSRLAGGTRGDTDGMENYDQRLLDLV